MRAAAMRAAARADVARATLCNLQRLMSGRADVRDGHASRSDELTARVNAYARSS